MHEKTSVAGLIGELYTFLRQADTRELGGLFRSLDAARDAGDAAKEKQVQAAIDGHRTHVVPIIADIDAGFGNAEATYLMAKQMIEAGIFHHLITLPTYHTAALSTDNLAKEYFGDKGMLGYVEGVQRKEIRQGIACVKHQNMAGSDMGDDHKEYFAGEAALKASGKDNTMNQF